MNESQTAWESLTPEEKSRSCSADKSERWICFSNEMLSSKHNMIKASEISLKKWVLRINNDNESHSAVGLILFLKIVDNFSDLHKHYISRT